MISSSVTRGPRRRPFRLFSKNLTSVHGLNEMLPGILRQQFCAEPNWKTDGSFIDERPWRHQECRFFTIHQFGKPEIVIS